MAQVGVHHRRAEQPRDRVPGAARSAPRRVQQTSWRAAARTSGPSPRASPRSAAAGRYGPGRRRARVPDLMTERERPQRPAPSAAIGIGSSGTTAVTDRTRRPPTAIRGRRRATTAATAASASRRRRGSTRSSGGRTAAAPRRQDAHGSLVPVVGLGGLGSGVGSGRPDCRKVRSGRACSGRTCSGRTWSGRTSSGNPPGRPLRRGRWLGEQPDRACSAGGRRGGDRSEPNGPERPRRSAGPVRERAAPPPGPPARAAGFRAVGQFADLGTAHSAHRDVRAAVPPDLPAQARNRSASRAICGPRTATSGRSLVRRKSATGWSATCRPGPGSPPGRPAGAPPAGRGWSPAPFRRRPRRRAGRRATIRRCAVTGPRRGVEQQGVRRPSRAAASSRRRSYPGRTTADGGPPRSPAGSVRAARRLGGRVRRRRRPASAGGCGPAVRVARQRAPGGQQHADLVLGAAQPTIRPSVEEGHSLPAFEFEHQAQRGGLAGARRPGGRSRAGADVEVEIEQGRATARR